MFCKSYNDFFQVLANSTNQVIINSLLKNSQNVSEIIVSTKIEQSKVSHSLKRMHECKIVDVEKKGKERIYSLNKKTILPILSIVDNHAKDMCPTCEKMH